MVNTTSWWDDIFERDDMQEKGGAFLFVIPQTAMSADSVKVELKRIDGKPPAKWHLSYEENSRTYTGVGDDQTAAYFALIGDRLGYDVVATTKPEEDDDPGSD